jgi:hypothetical protein
VFDDEEEFMGDFLYAAALGWPEESSVSGSAGEADEAEESSFASDSFPSIGSTEISR